MLIFNILIFLLEFSWSQNIFQIAGLSCFVTNDEVKCTHQNSNFHFSKKILNETTLSSWSIVGNLNFLKDFSVIITRNIIQNGFHAELSTEFSLQSIKLKKEQCSFLLIFVLPSSAYFDPDEINDRIRLGYLGRSSINIFGHSLVETPAWLALPCGAMVSIPIPLDFDVLDLISITIPIHFRYQSPSTINHSVVSLSFPFVFLHCTMNESNTTQKTKQIHTIFRPEQDLNVYIPRGNSNDQLMVTWMTFLAVILAMIFIIQQLKLNF